MFQPGIHKHLHNSVYLNKEASLQEADVPDLAFDSGLGQWLKCESRCFGDKGDVEDITEGRC